MFICHNGLKYRISTKAKKEKLWRRLIFSYQLDLCFQRTFYIVTMSVRILSWICRHMAPIKSLSTCLNIPFSFVNLSSPDIAKALRRRHLEPTFAATSPSWFLVKIWKTPLGIVCILGLFTIALVCGSWNWLRNHHFIKTVTSRLHIFAVDYPIQVTSCP